ncbi:MAG TPA: hypothetical protein VFE47_14480 [Tepidisphaeraceae bacterium]|nr:hypothetical protein [Tepidisphaeraceae bacterium]
MPEFERKRTVRSVTLDDTIVERAKLIGAKLVPPETSLSRLIDRSLAEFVQRHTDKRRVPKK